MTLFAISLTWLRYRRDFAVVTEVIENEQPLFFLHADDESEARRMALEIAGWRHRPSNENDYSLTVRPAVLSDLSAHTDEVAMRGVLRLEV